MRQLADWGANVIKIEMPPDAAGGDAPGGPREGSDFQNLHRNKRSMTLNLKSKEGRAAFLKMVKKADVIVENFRPDVKRRLKIDYKDVKKINPRIVYGSISGFGQDGPYENRPGFDQIAQGMGGLMSITGLPGQGPVRVGIPVADLTAGLFCALGILTALLEREKSKKGQHISTSLLQAQIFMLDFQAARWLINKEVPKQAGNDHPTSIPTGVFKTTDGHINIATTGGAIWERFCKAIGAEAMMKKPDYATAKARSENRKALNEEIGTYTQHKSSAEWIDIMNKAGVPCGPIYNIDQVFADPQVKHLGIAQSVEEAGQVDDERGRPAVHDVAHHEQDRGAAAGHGPAHQRGAEGIRIQRQGNRRAASSQGRLTRLARAAFQETDMNQSAPITPQTDKMLSSKEGSVGYVIFNNPERHNAVSLDMWAGGGQDARRLPQRQQHQGRRGDRRGRQGLRVGRRHLALRAGAFLGGRGRALQRGRRDELRRVPRVPEADHRHDPRLLHRRRHGARHLLRPPHRHRRLDVRGAGGQARPGLRLFRPEAAGRRGRRRRSRWRFSTRRGNSPQPRR